MDQFRESEFPPDLSPLAWVQEELRRSLESVHKALRRMLRDGDSKFSVLGAEVGSSSQSLLGAAAQLHQVAGVLSLVGLPAGATVLRAAEQAVQFLAERTDLVDPFRVETIERANFALLSYIARLLAGNKASTLSLFPAYRELQTFVGAERVHPADLWQYEWRWCDVPDETGCPALAPETGRAPFEAALLKHMRTPSPAFAGRLSDLCAGLAAGLIESHSKTLWQLAAAQFQAQALGLLDGDAFVKRLGSRLLSQLKLGRQVDPAVQERLAQDLLFFCAQARDPANERMAPRLSAVRRAFGLNPEFRGDYEDQTLGHIDPAWVAQARRRVGVAKESWGSAAEGDSHRLAGLDEQFAAVAESLQRLFPSGEVLGQTLQRAVVATLRSGQPPRPALAMEVATSMLYVEAALDDAAFDQPEQAERVRALAQRIDAVAHGDAPQPLEAWMEDLYRRVSDRQTLGSVVHELRASLSDIERQADEYFRDPAQRQKLIPVPAQLSAMRGVLTVLGLDQAALACLRMRDEVDELANTEVDTERGGPRELFERLANNLGALGFLIDMLSVQPQLAKRMFVFEEASGRLNPVMGRRADASPLPPMVASAPAPLDGLMHLDLDSPSAPTPLQTLDSQSPAALGDLGLPELSFGFDSAPELAEPASMPEPAEASLAPAEPAPAAFAQDPEMQEIFLEEAGEVLGNARAALAALQEDGSDREQLTVLRRAFHTLKGSSRMVGFDAYGEGAWACEQLFNARLADATPQADAPLLAFSAEALDYLGQWCEQIAGRQSGAFIPDPLRRSANALRLQGEALALDWPGRQLPSEEMPAEPLAEAPAQELFEPAPAEAEAAAEVEPLQALIDASAEQPGGELSMESLPESEAAPEPIESQAEAIELAEQAEPSADLELPVELPELSEEVLELPELALPELTLPELTLAEPPLLTDEAAVPAVSLAPDLADPDLGLDLELPALSDELPTVQPTPTEFMDEPVELPSWQATAIEPAPTVLSEGPDTELLTELATELLPELGPDLGEAEPLLGDAGLMLELDAGAAADAQPPVLTDLLELDLLGEGEAAADSALEAAQAQTPTDVLPAAAETVLSELPSEAEDAAASEFASLDALDLPLTLDLPLDAAEAAPETVSQAVPDFELPEFELNLDLGELVGEPLVPAEPEVVAEAEDAAETEAEALADLANAIEPPVAAPAVPHLSLVSSGNSQAGDVDAGEGEAADETAEEGDEGVKRIGSLRIGITLFNIFLNEADELSRRLATGLAEWAMELNPPLPAQCEALAHALAGNSATVGYEDLSTLARALEHALGRAQRAQRFSEADAQLFERAAEDIRQLLHQFAAGFLRPHDASLVERLHSYEPEVDSSLLGSFDALDDLETPDAGDIGPTPTVVDDTLDLHLPAYSAAALEPAPSRPTADQDEVEPGLPDEIDAVLLPIFEEEARELLPQLHAALRDWLLRPQDRSAPDACMRALHTFKGGARLTGAMRLGEQAHELESAVEVALAMDPPDNASLQALQDGGDALEASLDRLLASLLEPEAAVPVPEVLPVAELVPALESGDAPVADAAAAEAELEVLAAAEPGADVEAEQVEEQAAPAPPRQIDWSRFSERQASPDDITIELPGTGPQAMVRVRGSLLERMAAQAGEVSIRRARLESELAQMKGSLLELDDNLARLRNQLRELELQAEAQMGTQQELHQKAGRDFDPLEFDRYTRFQELTKMLTESVGDVATVQRALQRNVQLGEDELAAQSRLTRELQDDLLRTRLIEFESLGERMHRVVRQAARDAGRQAQLEIIGGQTELDRSVLERMAGPFEHLLRNSISHGIEAPEQRQALGKPVQGTVRLELRQESNEVLLTFSDDGAGLDLKRIRERGEQLGLIQPGETLSEAALMQLIFTSGFSTATQVTELSGRGVGMDVVRAEVSTLGGSITTESKPGLGTSFALRLPLTTALTQVVLLRSGDQVVAVPASLMASLQRVPAALVEEAYATGNLQHAGQVLPFYWLGGLLGQPGRGHGQGKYLPVVLMRSAQQSLALHVDEVLGNQEVVVKNLGAQLSRVPGLAGVSLLASGDVALIYNPVALAAWYGPLAQQRLLEAREAAQHVAEQGIAPKPVAESSEDLPPLVLVVDDSLTVRRVTQRLLEREGYRVQLAKDGLDAMEALGGDELPVLVLSDIEMPRMDGFDLLRNIRADARLRELPVVMITSRIAQKHRDYAEQLGADHYLGKPYDEAHLLELIARYTAAHAQATQAAAL
ncbi:Hpt domain-containing protein [Paucibacter sp. DJ1R-11]|uniref:hybrid sensor histidine kinase/response regulator n=1 Tax=Paucibacter sp. DJ1R-11 TaxID=2893556 RepID=UPI0021E36966|nr:Hpt domain-containing protein [Paucibacter sp. DJ1R-11]MCV2364598.1 Hpt domain-containing protein [Paucibacter sp. DJ1R-11]